MPYINAELLNKERLSLRAHEDGIEVSREEGAELRLCYSPDLTLQEVRETLKLVSSSFSVEEGGQKSLPRMDNDPEVASRRWWPRQEMLEDPTSSTAHIVTELNE